MILQKRKKARPVRNNTDGEGLTCCIWNLHKRPGMQKGKAMRARFIIVNSSYVIYLNYSIQLFDFQ